MTENDPNEPGGDASRFARVRALFDQALERPAEERAAFLDEACQGDAELRAEVEAMLVADSEADSGFLASPFAVRSHLDKDGNPRVLGGFTLARVIGHGGMGAVYAARQAGLDREVAVKVLGRSFAAGDADRERFRREPRRLAQLDHPNIVRVLDTGHEEQEDILWFAMELVDGDDLHKELRRAIGDADPDEPPARIPIKGAPDHITFAVTLCRDVARALAAAHDIGIVHRDIKPGNLLLDSQLRVKVTDFGLARDESFGTLTGSDEIAGTLPYMSPEQARLVADKIDHRTDVYSLGVVLYELLTHIRPFDGDTALEVRQRIQESAPKNPRSLNREIPRELEFICLKAIAPDVRERYETATAFAEDLDRFLQHKVVLAGPPSLRRRVTSLFRRNRAASILLGLAAAGVALWFGASTLEAASTRRRAVQRVVALPAASVQTGDELVASHLAARQILAEQDLSGDQVRTVESRVAEFVAEAHRRHAQGIELIIEGSGGAAEPGGLLLSPSQTQQLLGVRMATLARAIDPTLRDPLEVLESTFPHVEITDPRGASAAPLRIVGLDPLTSEETVVVTPPDAVTPQAIALPPGFYRIRVGTPDAFAEYTRVYLGSGEWTIEPNLVPTDDATADMIFIPAGPARIGNEGNRVYPPRDVEHEAFYIDRCEVTCREYLEFVFATNAPMPHTWKGEYRDAWDDLPVVGVSLYQARAYAAFRGKRLPTWTEWQIAARGREGFLYPSGNDPAELDRIRGIRSPRETPWWAGVHAVGTDEADRSVFGVMDVIGNASEAVGSPVVTQLEIGLFSNYAWHIVAGSNWKLLDALQIKLDVIMVGVPLKQYHGFRCAKILLRD